MSLIQLASGNSSGGGSGPFITGSVSSLAALAFDISIGSVSPSQLESFVNQAAYQAEAGQPEGAAIELDISGWTFLGTDYSQQVANEINSYWQQGEFTVNGEDMQAWPGASQIAYGGNDTLTVQYLKGQIWVLYIALAVALVFVALYLVQYFTGQSWSVGVNSATTTSTGMPLWEKLLIGGLIGTGAVIGLMFWGRLEIAKAGANKSYQEIVVER
jgi:hypothetical protein